MQNEQRLQWWQEARFGMFIHWGLYALPAGTWNGQRVKGLSEWIMRNARIPIPEYEALAEKFCPDEFDADAWVELAQQAGMKYLVIGAKHHDGFCMFRSPGNPYNIVERTPFGRDPMAELADACRKRGIRLCFYYSQALDWHADGGAGHWDEIGTGPEWLSYARPPEDFQRYLDEVVKPDLQALLTQYGPVGLIWFDTPVAITAEQSRALRDFVHALQPDCLVSGRVGHDVGDYGCLGDNEHPAGRVEGAWETPATLNDSWGYNASDQNWKSLADLLIRLVDCASKGVNFLLNVGPTAEGIIPQRSRLEDLGAWLARNGESIYGTQSNPFPVDPTWGGITWKGHTLYLLVKQWPKDGKLRLFGLHTPVTSARLFPRSQNIEFHQDGHVLTLFVPELAPEEIVSVLAVELTGTPGVDDGIMQDGDAAMVLPISAAKLSGRAQMEKNGCSGNWMDTQSTASWRFHAATTGPYAVTVITKANKVELTRVGTHMIEVTLDGASIQGAVGAKDFDAREGAPWMQYPRSPVGTLHLETAGEHVLTVRVCEIDPGADLGFRLIAVQIKPITTQWIDSESLPEADAAAGVARQKLGVRPWVAPWIAGPSVSPRATSPAPLFRKEFDLAAMPECAVVTVQSAAYFELYINGDKVGHDVLTPAVSNLQHRSFSVSYDVRSCLRTGRNCMGLWMGIGWADNIEVRAQLDAVVDGQRIVLVTDTTWQTHNSGYYRIGKRIWNDFGGERIDAREFVPHWSKVGLDTGAWSDVVTAQGLDVPVCPQPCPLNRIGQHIPAVAVQKLADGRYEIDFGMALTGWLQLKLPPLERGTVVALLFADKHLEEDYQHFNQISEFVSAGGENEVFQHKFNYAGFRYVVIKGLPTAPAREDTVALLVESDLEEAGSFACSHDLFNRIHQANQWTQRCLNLGGYYVDCPHRERMGYGDGQVAVEGFMTSFRADRFYRKWLHDWRLRQMPNGNLPHMAPFGQGGGGPGWGGLLAGIAWKHYLYYGDAGVLAENYDAIRRYVDYLESICQDNILRRFGGKWDFIGDWVPPRRGMDTDNWPTSEAAEFFNNGYRLYQMHLLIQMAEVLGKADDATRYRARMEVVRPAVHAAFYRAEEACYVIDEQAYYVMALMTGIAPESEREHVLQGLERNILEKNQGHLDTGMLGTYFMMEYLREIGRNDLVYTMFNQTTYPGWGYMLEQGATTLWEQWNGYYSQIHSCFTSPDNWFYQGLAGIQPDPQAPGFSNVIIKPAFAGEVTWVKAHHDGPYGRIVCHWRRESERVMMDLIIPAHSTATLYLPVRQGEDITINDEQPRHMDLDTHVRIENNFAVLKLKAGTYSVAAVLAG